MLTRPWVIVCLSCLLVGSHSFATTIIPPVSLAELGKDSHAVVLARSRGSWTVGEEWLATRTSLVVETSLSGGLRAGTIFEVETPGGDDGNRAFVVPGSPRFDVGATYLLHLLQVSPAVWVPRLASYGILEQVQTSDGRTLLTPLGGRRGQVETLPRPDGQEVEPIYTYEKKALLAHLGASLTGRTKWDVSKASVQKLPSVLEAVPAGCNYHFVTGGDGTRFNFRWSEFDNGGSIAMAADQSNDAQVDALSLIPAALQDWNNVANSSLNIAYGPTGTGADSGAVVIESNLPGMAQVLVPLSGTGTAIPGGLQIPGDCNQDGAIDISDPVCLLGFLFLGRPTELPCGSPGLPEPDGPTTEADFALMDWNGDRNVDLSDVVAPLNALFGGALPHVLDVSGTGKSCIRIRGCPNVCVP